MTPGLPADAPPAIEITGLGKTFRGADGPIVAVDHLDLRIDRGEVVALLGPNGAGKTTTLDLVLGLTTPTTGTVLVAGTAPRAAVSAGRVAAVLQTGGLLGDLTVGETVRYIAATFAELGHVPVDEVMERAGITGLGNRRVAACSGGEQQRLRFALALLPDPELLILDEPTAGLDVSGRREFWAAMHEEAREGRTIVFATHYLGEADAFAERIVLLAGGRCVADGPTAEIRSRAAARVVSADVPDPDRARTVLTGLGARVEVIGNRIVAHSAGSDAVALALLTDLGGHDLEIVGGSLEDAFIAITDGAAPAGRIPPLQPSTDA